ncbi:MAG TPA: hypothetical protein VH054_15330 [Polyangiaceae bacterium]|jgi:hypothetical protein|nr:hypothetical protein [Polyangiaceae bacterium]
MRTPPSVASLLRRDPADRQGDRPRGTLTYCSNVDFGDSWAEARRALEGAIADMRRRVAPNGRLGIGVRFSARTLRELLAPGVRAELEFVLARDQMYVFKIDARDERPDWLEHARFAYTCRAAELLATLVPEGLVGTISTVPGALGDRAHMRGARNATACRLLAAAAHLADLRARTGRRIVVSIEPEPGGMIEGAFDTVTFFRDHVFHGEALRGARIDEQTARAHIGVRLIAAGALATLEREGITVTRQTAEAA